MKPIYTVGQWVKQGRVGQVFLHDTQRDVEGGWGSYFFGEPTLADKLAGESLQTDWLCYLGQLWYWDFRGNKGK